MDVSSGLVDFLALVNRSNGLLPRVLTASLVLVVFWLGYRTVRRPIETALARTEMQPAVKRLLVDKLLRTTVLLVAVVMAADQLGINVGAAVASLGVAGIALGFAAQDSVANMIAGVLIVWDRPFQVGHWIEVEGEFGCVSEITLRSTRIRTLRNTMVVIPNRRIIDATVENASMLGALRVDVPVGIAYRERIDEARAVLLGAVASLDGLRDDRQPDVVVTELGGSSVNLAVRVWIDSGEQSRAVYARVLECAKSALDEAGIEIPFPHLQLVVNDTGQKLRLDRPAAPGEPGA